MSWPELADVFNKNLRGDDEEWWSESAYRKKYSLIKSAYEEIFSNSSTSEDYTEQIRELQIAKQQLRDERTEYSRLLREEARRRSWYDQFVSAVENHVDAVPQDVYSAINNNRSDNDMIIHLTDLHVGIKIDNWFNQYDDNVFENRLQDFLSKIVEVKQRHNCENAYVILGGDLISGASYVSLRSENNQDLVDQFLTVSDNISGWLSKIAPIFNELHVYLTPGNHGRMTPNKKDCLAHENFDNLVLPYIKAKMQNFENVFFHHNEIEQSIAMFSVRGNAVFATHGDKDSIERIVNNMTNLFHIKPDICFVGHKHYNRVETFYDTKVIQTGCLSGTDNYAVDLRLYNKPEQTITIVNECGVDCVYNVTFTE